MKIIKKLFLIILGVIIIGLLIPQNLKMPVVGANQNSYNHETFWHPGWGSSIVHKGVDIFAKKGTCINSATNGIVFKIGNKGKGGKYVIIIGPKWRMHYYAHLDTITVKPFQIVTKNTQIGTVGNTGNAKTTPPHLHYGIFTLIPYPWEYKPVTQGELRMFYLNPIKYL